MKHRSAANDYVVIPIPAPMKDHICASCGCDPVHLWQGQTIIGGDWNARIESKGRLCYDCASDSAAHIKRQYPDGVYPEWLTRGLL